MCERKWSKCCIVITWTYVFIYTNRNRKPHTLRMFTNAVGLIRATGEWQKKWRKHPEWENIHDTGLTELVISFLKPQWHPSLLSILYKEGNNHWHDEDVIISWVNGHSKLTPWIDSLLELIQEICLHKETIYSFSDSLIEQNGSKLNLYKKIL